MTNVAWGFQARSIKRYLLTSSIELAHQWFGNLVTMDWWNELWLNEGFATWVGWLAVDHFYPGKFLSNPNDLCLWALTHAQNGTFGPSLSYATPEVIYPSI